MIYILYGILGYLIIALVISFGLEIKMKRVRESNWNIENILNGGYESLRKFTVKSFDSLIPDDMDHDSVEVPDELIDYSRARLLDKLTFQKKFILSSKEIMVQSLWWPFFLTVLMYVGIFHRPKQGQSYEEWAREIENKRKE